jgi:hypothetical protein
VCNSLGLTHIEKKRSETAKQNIGVETVILIKFKNVKATLADLKFVL